MDPREPADKSLQDNKTPDAGLSERIVVFEPGLKVGRETVVRTFQPSFTVTTEGTLIAFCQGRVGEGWDDDMKVVLVNRSFDQGRTWEGARAICAPMNHFAISSHTTGEKGAEVISFLTCVDLHLTREYYDDDMQRMRDQTGLDLEKIGTETAGVLCRFVSIDLGLTWRMEVLTGDRSPLGKQYDGGTLLFLNAIGQIQEMETGPHQGRLFLAAPLYAEPDREKVTSHFRNHPCSGSGVLFSDDKGWSWQMRGFITDFLANEASAVSIHDGEALLMVRRMAPPEILLKTPVRTDFRPEFGHRIFQTSSDWGETWSDYSTRPMSGVPCHGTMARVDNRIYFSIPQGYGPDVELGWDKCREQGTIYFSDDDGETWKHRVIEPETFAYNTVGTLSETQRICFYSQGKMGEEGIACRVFTDAWLDEA